MLNFVIFAALFWAFVEPSVDDFYQLSAVDIHGKQVDFSQFEGKAVLVVNVASQCGYTDNHYKALKRLQDILSFNNKLVILAFPCNQFGGQEPGTKDEILDVVNNRYGAKRLRLMAKVEVTGPGAHPVWKYLTGQSGVVPQWNFYKYLLDHHGQIIGAWPPQTPVEDIFDIVERAVHEADGEVQVESPLGAEHDEL